MAWMANLPIGKKLTFALGGIVLLLTGLSGLSLWGIYQTEYDTEKAIQQLTQSTAG